LAHAGLRSSQPAHVFRRHGLLSQIRTRLSTGYRLTVAPVLRRAQTRARPGRLSTSSGTCQPSRLTTGTDLVRTALTTGPNAGWTRTPCDVSNPTLRNELEYVRSNLSTAGYAMGVPTAWDDRRPPSCRMAPGSITLWRTTGRRNDQPKLRRAVPCGCPASRQASRGRPLTAPRRTWATIQGPATSGLHIPPHDVVSLQVSLLLLHTALESRAP
jgi:hypothetical protein